MQKINITGQNANQRAQTTQKYFIAINKNLGLEIKSNNQTQFAKEWNLQQSNIGKCLNNKPRYKSCKGWTFKWCVPKIGLDFDGCIADLIEAFIREYKNEYNILLKKEDMTDYWLETCLPVSLESVRKVMDKIIDDPIKTDMKFIDGAKEFLLELSKNSILFFITARPNEWQVYKWLQKMIPEIPLENIRVIAVGDHLKKLKEIKKLKIELFIDDYADTCQILHNNGIKCILFDQPWNHGNFNFPRIKSWSDLNLIDWSN